MLFTFYWTTLPLGQRGARMRMDCTAYLLLVFVWDKTASGTARSKTEKRHSIPLPILFLAVAEAVSPHTKMRSRSAVQSIFCDAPRCPRGSLVPYKSVENQFHLVLASLGTGAPMGSLYLSTVAAIFCPFPPHEHRVLAHIRQRPYRPNKSQSGAQTVFRAQGLGFRAQGLGLVGFLG